MRGRGIAVSDKMAYKDEAPPPRPASPPSFSPIDSVWQKIKANDRLHVAWCVVGIVGCLMFYGVLQVRREGAG
jgi:hypothetical protein